MSKFVYGSGEFAGQPLDPERPPIPMNRGRWKKFLKWLDKWGDEIAFLFYLIERGIVLFGSGGGGFRAKPIDKAATIKEELNKSKQAGL
jgi:hypothetical protein